MDGHLKSALTLVLGATVVVCLEAAPRYSAWAPAVSIGPVVDPTETDDGLPCLSKDGRSLFFTSNRVATGSQGRYDIWVTRWDEETLAWGAPVDLGPNINSPLGDFAPTLSRDQHWLFFASNRAGGFGRRDLYASYRDHTDDDLAWGPAVNLGPVVNSAADEIGATYFENDDAGRPQLFFATDRSGISRIYVAEMDESGHFGTPVPVPGLSSPEGEGTPAIRHDGLELFFSSRRAGGFGDFDIWVVTRDTVFDPWSEPLNVGPHVNTPTFDAGPAISSDGLRLFFFHSDTTPGPGELRVCTRAKIDGK